MWILRTADGIIARGFFSVGFFTEHDNIREMIRSGIQGRGELVQHPRDPTTVSWVGKDGGERFQAVSPVLENFRRRFSRSG